MDRKTFDRFRERIETLTVQQVRELSETLKKIDSRVELLSKFDGRGKQITECLHCGSTRLKKWGSTRTGLMRRRCAQCGKTFSSATNTPVHCIRNVEGFNDALRDMCSASPYSCRRLAKELGVNKMTVWRWRHRILNALKGIGADVLSGIVEVDEKLFRESRKGSREWVNHYADPKNFPEPPRLRWLDYRRLKIKNAATGWQMPVLTSLDRSGGRRADILPKGKADPILETLSRHVSDEAVLCSDADAVYSLFARKHGVPHHSFNSKVGPRVIDRVYHIQTINSLHQRFESFMAPFKGPATKYLPKYAAWFLTQSELGRKSPVDEAWGRILAT